MTVEEITDLMRRIRDIRRDMEEDAAHSALLDQVGFIPLEYVQQHMEKRRREAMDEEVDELRELSDNPAQWAARVALVVSAAPSGFRVKAFKALMQRFFWVDRLAWRRRCELYAELRKIPFGDWLFRSCVRAVAPASYGFKTARAFYETPAIH